MNHWTGKHHSLATRLKMSKAQTGRVITRSARKKIRKALLGRKASAELRRKLSESVRNRSSEWKAKVGKSFRGVPKSASHKQKISKALKGRVFTAEHRHRISESWKHRTAYIRTPESKENMRQAIIKRIQSHPGPFKDTGIERTIQNALSKRGIAFQTQVNIRGMLVDILISGAGVVIECDGCYWHCCPTCQTHTKVESIVSRIRSKDAMRTKALANAGYAVVRLWGHEIESDAEKCVDRIQERMSRK